MKLPVFLRVYLNGKLENVKQFSDEQVVIGRNNDLQLNLPDTAVAPIHAYIEERDSGYYVCDLGSQSGTLLNGRKVFDEKISSGDELQIGPYRIEFYIGVPKPKSAPVVQEKTESRIISNQESQLGGLKPPVEPEITKTVQLDKSTPEDTIKATTDQKSDLESPSTKSEEPKPKETQPEENKAEEKKSQTAVISPLPLPDPPQETQATSLKTPDRAFDGAKSPTSTSFNESDADKASDELVEKLKGSKGPHIEVTVSWKGRVIQTRHLDHSGSFTIGSSQSCDFVVPLVGMKQESHTFLKLGPAVQVCLTSEMTGDYFKNGVRANLIDLKNQNRFRPVSGGHEVTLIQGEMFRIGFHGGTVFVYIRFVPEVSKPLVGPMLDFTATEATAVIMSFVIAGLLGLYMWLYAPMALKDEDLIDEPLRMATVTFTPPPRQVVQVTDSPPQQETVRQPTPQPTQQRQQTTQQGQAGAAADPRPTERRDRTPQPTSTVRQGGAPAPTGEEGGNVQTETPRPSLLTAFGGGGLQQELEQAFSGAGGVIGEADTATGRAGQEEGRAGDGVGSRLRETGAGGRGSSTVGIAGVSTQGRGTGGVGEGTGGLGERGRVDINIEGTGAEFTGTIDRDAIRRVIRENRRAFQFCYESALRRNPDVSGRVEMQWDIEERGRATRVSVKSSEINDREFGRCMVSRISSLTFPEPPANQVARVVYPFLFRNM